MKVSRIEIKDFQQFKDFELDLTYPENHPTKAGQPLDKVCFIGQSGTGKTTILGRIKAALHLMKAYVHEERGVVTHINRSVKETDIETDKQDEITFKHNEIISKWVTFSKDRYFSGGGTYKNIEKPNGEKYLVRALFESKVLIYVFIGAELLDKSSAFLSDLGTINTEIYLSSEQKDREKIEKEREVFKNKRYYDFSGNSQDNPLHLWEVVLRDASEYIIKFNKYYNQLKKIQIEQKDIEEDNLKREIKTWRENNTNPFEKVAKKINLFLGNFNIEMKIPSFDDPNELQKPIFQVKSKKSAISPYLLSSGIKQIFLTTIPLFALDTKDTIIMFDEPERSLFPDIQRTLIDYYVKLAPEAQFFFATHSPIIASQFEPCERFILSFDEETGFVKVRNGIAPEGDDPNDLLSKDFGMRNLMGEKGLTALHRFVELKTLIRNEKDEPKKEAFANEYLTLQRLYNF